MRHAARPSPGCVAGDAARSSTGRGRARALDGTNAPGTTGASRAPARPIWAFDLVYDSANDRVVDRCVRNSITSSSTPGSARARRGGEVETAHAPSHRMDIRSRRMTRHARKSCCSAAGSCDELRLLRRHLGLRRSGLGAADPDASARRIAGEMAYDPAREEVVLYTAITMESGTPTWTWDGTNLDRARRRRQAIETTCSTSRWPGTASRQAVVLHGGFMFDDGSPVYPDETWAWDGDRCGRRWRKGARGLRSTGWRPVPQHVVLFGGTTRGVDSATPGSSGPRAGTRSRMRGHPESWNFQTSSPRSVVTDCSSRRSRVRQTPPHWVFRPRG